MLQVKVGRQGKTQLSIRRFLARCGTSAAAAREKATVASAKSLEVWANNVL